MLRKISIKNLGAFGEKECLIDFSEETLLAGPNNTGKSLALSALNFLRILLLQNGSFTWSTQFYNFVNFREIIHKHDESKLIYLSLEMCNNTKFEVVLGSSRPITMSTTSEDRKRNFMPSDAEPLKDIWYLRPNRTNVPFSSIVQPTSTVFQPLNPDGSNVSNFLLERYTDRDKRWSEVETWLRKVDPEITEMKTPVRGNNVYFETAFGDLSVNASLQGSGIQNAIAIIGAVIFSKKGSTIIVEEPEAFLHPSSQEVLVDLFNKAVNEEEKQIIFSTHSFNIIKPFWNDVGLDKELRGQEHPRANPDKFRMLLFKKTNCEVFVETYPMQQKTFRQLRDDFKQYWG